MKLLLTTTLATAVIATELTTQHCNRRRSRCDVPDPTPEPVDPTPHEPCRTDWV